MKLDLRRGQIGLLLLVIMGLVVALVMSVASRSLSDTVLSRQERESSAAFSVAETGIENALYALRMGNVPEGVITLPATDGFVTGEYAVSTNAGFGLFVREGESAHLDLSGYGGTLNIAWTKKSDQTENIASCAEGSGFAPAAIEVSAISPTSVTRYYYNPYNCSPESNQFAQSGDGGSLYRSQVSNFAFPPGTSMLRIKPIYSDATIAVTGLGLSSQLYLIQSKASGGDARKEIEVRRGLDSPATVFDYAIFTTGTIVK